jgi:hypothetical protein
VPAAAGGPNWHVNHFHLYLLYLSTGVCVFVQNHGATSLITPYRRARNDYEYFDNRIIGDGKIGPMAKRLREIRGRRTS